MKKLLPLVAIFLLSLSVVAQDTKPPKGFVRNYDKFKDLTEVSFTDSGFLPPYYTGWFRHEGQKLEADIDKFYITFRGYRCTGFCFKSPTLIFIIDGERLAMPRDGVVDDDPRAHARSVAENAAQRPAPARGIASVRVGFGPTPTRARSVSARSCARRPRSRRRVPRAWPRAPGSARARG